LEGEKFTKAFNEKYLKKYFPKCLGWYIRANVEKGNIDREIANMISMAFRAKNQRHTEICTNKSCSFIAMDEVTA
jgi:hypothetical protein